MKTLLKNLKKGDYFRFKDYNENEIIPESSVWIRGDFERSSKRYSCIKFCDCNHERILSGDSVVYVGFNF